MLDDSSVVADFILSDELAEALIGRKPLPDERVTIDQRHDCTRAYIMDRDSNVKKSVDVSRVIKDIDTDNLYKEKVDSYKRFNKFLRNVRLVAIVSISLLLTLALFVLTRL